MAQPEVEDWSRYYVNMAKKAAEKRHYPSTQSIVDYYVNMSKKNQKGEGFSPTELAVRQAELQIKHRKKAIKRGKRTKVLQSGKGKSRRKKKRGVKKQSQKKKQKRVPKKSHNLS